MAENNVFPTTLSDEDEALKTLLLSWNSEQKFDSLKNENITINILKILNSEQVQELTSNWKIGDKAIFNYHFRIWRKKINSPFSPENSESWNRCERDENTTPLSSQGTSSSHSIFASPDTDDSSNVDVLQILNATSFGCKVVNAFKKNNYLTEEHRNVIIKSIVQHFEKYETHMSLQTCYKIEQQILHLFPSEKLEFYRTERRGRIYMKYHNMKKSCKHLFDDEENLPTSSKMQKHQIHPEANAHLLVQSLKYDNLSAEEFNSTWLACTQYRLNQTINGSGNISEVLEIWPQYKTPNGYKLIEKDFDVLYKSYNTTINWGPKIVKLFNFLKTSKAVKLQNGDMKLFETLKPDSDPDKFAYITLYVLHSVLIPTARCVRKTVLGKSEVTRFTIKDSQQSFIFLGNSMQELESHIDFLIQKRENVQPFILGIGNLNAISQYFIYFDGTLFPFKAFLRSLDILFKIFHVFHLQYPTASNNVWCFIEQYLYEIHSCSKKNVKVCILLEALKKT